MIAHRFFHSSQCHSCHAPGTTEFVQPVLRYRPQTVAGIFNTGRCVSCKYNHWLAIFRIHAFFFSYKNKLKKTAQAEI